MMVWYIAAVVVIAMNTALAIKIGGNTNGGNKA